MKHHDEPEVSRDILNKDEKMMMPLTPVLYTEYEKTHGRKYEKYWFNNKKHMVNDTKSYSPKMEYMLTPPKLTGLPKGWTMK